MKGLRGICIIIGGAIGAGFISGAELIRFFHTQYFFFPVMLSALFFFLQCALFLWLGRTHGGYEGALNILFKRAAPAVRAVIVLCAFIPCAGMLAGLDALLPALKPLLSLTGLLLSAAVLQRGTGGISFVNLLLVPILLGFVFMCGSGEKAFYYPLLPEGTTGFFGGALYAGMNAFLLAPVLLDAGRDVKNPVLLSAVAAAVIALSALTILGCVYREGAGALNAEMPFLYVMRGEAVFSVAVALAVMTSLASSLYPLMQSCNRFKRRKKYAAKACVLLAAFCISRLGFVGIISLLYPVLGGLGLLLSMFCALNEYLFKQHHKKVHSSGENAENQRCAHHKIEPEHLPTVHDEVAQPRP